MLISDGASLNVNPDRLSVPPELVTDILPETAFDGTIAVILDVEFMVKELAFTPPNLTSVTFSRLVPVIVISFPCAAVFGVKSVMAGL